ncbi:hypothetical protein BJL85_22400 [Vibrio parahaemolyticus]|uniref:hypothetical protein n=1 Tax=Vibrio harveyi group TaxID=717610 RepID=UPI0003A42040|nr:MULTISPECIES: hypothetical protein [Vibrio harveyi group]EHS7465822.1 hypothetical protein [Vibrio cholerae]AVW95448.1 hypothetical protein DA442_10035 [Vibrio parahaemolyticus]EGQ8907601.1 hypothetical protein [Vibrio parahaemolyticus]EGQ9162809.1 hypothetical protein [Vibrio parahaemolyticus]EGQ9308786.1 hypothetical protein [Vibrio parahaemolyticus]
MNTRVKALMLFLFLMPLAGYVWTFRGGFSDVSSDWADFGSYVGGVYGALGFFAVAFSIYSNSRQNLKLEQDQVFYKSMELLNSRISNSSIFINDQSYQGATILKKMVSRIKEELDEQCVSKARVLLCKVPESIDNVHYIKILEAKYGNYFYSQYEEHLSSIKSELMEDSDFNNRWERIKYYIGSTNSETKEMRAALMALGHVWFYKLPLEERKEMYSSAVSTLEYEFGEFVNGYIKNLKFIARFVSDSVNRDLYLKFVLSQVSKYEIIILFHYAITSEDKDIIKVLMDLGLLNEVLNQECRSLLIDLPSIEEIENDLDSLKQQVS